MSSFFAAEETRSPPLLNCQVRERPRRASDALLMTLSPGVMSKLAITTELQRVSQLFEGISPISQAEFVVNCKNVMNILQYSCPGNIDSHLQTLLVDVTENAVNTFVIRVLPLVFQELITPTSFLHPISPPMIFSLLDAVDNYILQYGDFLLQLRMAAARLLLQNNEDVTLALSMCQTIPRIRPNSKRTPLFLSLKANPATNIRSSISLPEIQPNVVPDSPTASLDCTSLFGSSIPSLSSLLNCTASSSVSLQQYDPNHVNIITESVSLPSLSITSRSSLAPSSSAPNVQLDSGKPIMTSIPPPIKPQVILSAGDSQEESSSSVLRSQTPLASSEPATVVIYPVTAAESAIHVDSSLFNLPTLSLFSPDQETNEHQSPQNQRHDIPLIKMPDTCFEISPVDVENENSRQLETTTFPDIPSFASEDDFSRLAACSDVDEEFTVPSHISPIQDLADTDPDITLSIGPPHPGDYVPTSETPPEQKPLSPLPNQISSPLSSSPQTITHKIPQDIFLNTFNYEGETPEFTPYKRRLRSASANSGPLPTRRTNQQTMRSVSTSNRRKQFLDPGSTGFTLPPPPIPRKLVVPTNDSESAPRKTRARKPKVLSLSQRDGGIGNDEDLEPRPRRRSQRSRSVSVNKENN